MASAHDGHRERLRAQYAQCGADGFLDHQLLELLLTYCIPRKETNELAHALMERFGSLENIFRADIKQIESVAGAGEATALYMRLMRDIMSVVQKRRLEDKHGRIYLTTSLESARFALGLLFNEPYETFCIACLNKDRLVLHSKLYQSGTLSEAPVYPRQVAEAALLYRAHSVVIAHNHPSGNVTPSKDDYAVTEAIRAALNSLGVGLLDHLIVGGQDVYSYNADKVIRFAGSLATTLTLDEYRTQLMESYAPAVKVREPYIIMDQFQAMAREPW